MQQYNDLCLQTSTAYFAAESQKDTLDNVYQSDDN
jgi:hypothetical protein